MVPCWNKITLKNFRPEPPPLVTKTQNNKKINTKTIGMFTRFSRLPAWKRRGSILVSYLNLSLTYLFRHLPTYLEPRDPDMMLTYACSREERLIDWVKVLRPTRHMPRVGLGQGHPLLPPFSPCPFTSSFLTLFTFPFYLFLFALFFSSFVHIFPFYQNSPAAFPGLVCYGRPM